MHIHISQKPNYPNKFTEKPTPNLINIEIKQNEFNNAKFPTEPRKNPHQLLIQRYPKWISLHTHLQILTAYSKYRLKLAKQAKTIYAHITKNPPKTKKEAYLSADS